MAKQTKVVVTPEKVAEALKQIRRCVSMGDLQQLRMKIEAVASLQKCQVGVAGSLITIRREEKTGGFLGIGGTTTPIKVLEINKGASPPVVIQLSWEDADNQLVIRLGEKLKPGA